VILLTKTEFQKYCAKLFNFCDYPAAKYKIAFHLLDLPYSSDQLARLRPEFLQSDIVTQLYHEQSPEGNWGPLFNKNYSEKAVFPTTRVGIERCLYIGLTAPDREILQLALDYLEEYLRGGGSEPLYNRNERAVPWQMCDIACLAERIRPGNPLCDRLFFEWCFIAGQAFEDGEYSHERDMRTQHEQLGTREKRLVPLPVEFLLTRRADLPAGLEESMLHHFGRNAFLNGYFWEKNLLDLPETFQTPHTRRWFHTIKYVNQFQNNACYLDPAIGWLLENRNAEGLWDYGRQVNDPWGYFGNFSLNRQYSHNRIVDCTMEVLSILKTYLDHNS